MIEDIFLTYANSSLTEQPERLLEIFEKFKTYIRFDPSNIERLQKIIEHFVALVRCYSFKDAEKVWKRATGSREDIEDVGIAFDAIYGYMEDFCEELCDHGAERRKHIGNKSFVGLKRLKCHECDQLMFRKALAGIVENKEYTKLFGDGGNNYLLFLMNNAYVYFYTEFEVVHSPKNSHLSEELREKVVFYPYEFEEDGYGYQGHFSNLIIEPIIGYSLSQFLLHNDRRKLKKCQKCENFFCAKKIDERIKYCGKCSYLSPKSKEHRNQLMREWRKKKKNEKETHMLEARIENYMRNLGCTREDALEIIEADSKL